MNYHKNVGEDLSTHTRVQGMNVHAHILSHLHAFTPCALMYGQRSSQIFDSSSLLSNEIKFKIS